MRKIKVALITAAFLCGFSAVRAQDRNNPWQIGFGVNSLDIRTPDDLTVEFLKDWAGPRDINIIPAVSRISVGRYIGAGLSLEVAGSLNKIEKGYNYREGDTKISESFWDINGRLKYGLSNLIGEIGWFDPYLQVGGGYAQVAGKGDVKVLMGAGLNTWFNENIGLNFQSTYGKGFSDQVGLDYFQHSVGITIKFGGKDTDGDGVFDKEDECPNVAGLKQFNGCPDTDGDGIPDKDDACPEVAGTKAFNGCPDTDGDGIADKDDKCPEVAGTKALNGCPDTDGDGIADKDDKCPDQAGPKENDGCPWKDTDGDGVLDKDDLCPEVKGTVANKGCPELSQEVQKNLNQYAKTILFDTGKSVIKSSSEKVLNQIVDVLNEYKASKFAIEGHTDSTGSKTINQRLSQERADAVRVYLVRKGIDASRLTSKGYGQDKPIASNRNAKGRALNRRVEINLVK